jgi:hypothetical protein
LTALCLHLFLHPSHQRPIGTGRLRARRRFGYWGEQIGHLRDQSGHHFGARRPNSSLRPRVGLGTAMENVQPTGRPATDRQRATPRSGERILPPLRFPLYVLGSGAQARNTSPNHGLARIDLEPRIPPSVSAHPIRLHFAVNSGVRSRRRILRCCRNRNADQSSPDRSERTCPSSS